MSQITKNEYVKFYLKIKEHIHSARIQAVSAANRVLLALYWNIGREIVMRQEQMGWGKSIISSLAVDIKKEFNDLNGFSERNLWRMRSFYLAYRERVPKNENDNFTFLPQAVAEIPWGHHVLLLEKIKEGKERFWYARKTLEFGWSRNVLWHQIDSKLYERQGKALNNFSKTLPPQQSDLANQSIKDPYLFNFISADKKYREKELEGELLIHLQEFLLELGVGFAFVGRQKHLEIGGEDFYMDLLFYHTKLHAYVVIELKTGEFKPEYAGKMNFYLSAVDDILKQPADNPSIGIILCRTKNKIIVEYALKDTKKPIGVSAYKLTKQLPKNLKSSLPTIKEIEEEVAKTEEENKGK